jgi:hypothetical protein
LASDLGYLRNLPEFTTTVKKLVVCGQNMSLRGIQLITGTDSEETSLEHIGVNSPCDSWILPSNSYFTEAKIGYDSQGVTYLKATTDRGVEFVRGYLKSTDSSTVQTFTKE